MSKICPLCDTKHPDHAIRCTICNEEFVNDSDAVKFMMRFSGLSSFVRQYGLALLFFGLVIGIGFYVVRHNNLYYSSMSAETTATIVSTKKTYTYGKSTSGMPSNKYPKTDVEYVFTINNQEIRKKVQRDGHVTEAYPVGKKIAVCYDPNNPSGGHSEFKRVLGKCG